MLYVLYLCCICVTLYLQQQTKNHYMQRGAISQQQMKAQLPNMSFSSQKFTRAGPTDDDRHFDVKLALGLLPSAMNAFNLSTGTSNHVQTCIVLCWREKGCYSNERNFHTHLLFYTEKLAKCLNF